MIRVRDPWVSKAAAFSLLRSYFKSMKAFEYHLARRETNGLVAADAVRLTPFRKLIVNPDRVRAWAMSETAKAAA